MPPTPALAAAVETTCPVSVTAITKRFGGVVALDGVDLAVPAGSVTCLAGENGCGKSTLIKIVVGVERPDSGVIQLGSATHAHLTPPEAFRAGVQVIYQDLSLFPNLSAAENIALGALVPQRAHLVRPARMTALAEAVTGRLGVRLDLSREVGSLAVADRQLVAIGRALALDARVVFMDEPTTALTLREVAALFEVVHTLTAQGVAVVFVSHKLDEVFEISDQVTVLRAGRVTASGPARDFTTARLIRAMTGRDVVERRIVTPVADDAATVLRVRGLTLPGAFADIDFAVRAGEIVGLTGLLGSGRQEIADAVFGLLTPTAGEIEVAGVRVRPGSVTAAVAAGIGYVPADRLTQGLFLGQPIATNVVAASLDLESVRVGRWRTGWLRLRAMRRAIAELAARLRIKAPDLTAPARSLSGGNQQRVVLAKWLAREPKVLVLNMPTVGVDIGSKDEILQILRDQAAAGMAIVVISDDVPELAAICHTVHLVRRGRLAATLTGGDVSVESLKGELQR